MYVRSNSKGLGLITTQLDPTGGAYPAWGPYGPRLAPFQLAALQAQATAAAAAQPAAAAPAPMPALVAAATPALPSPSAIAPATIQATSPSGASVTQSAPPPGSWPTNQPYTDAAGNVWTFGATGWQITTPASSTAAGGSDFIATAQAWLLSSSLISALPNYGTVAIVVVGGILLMKMMGGKKR